MPMQIVFVDDSRSILKTIEILLQDRVKKGEIAIKTFSKSIEFLDAVESRSFEFDMLFLDINMPALSGYDLLQKLQEMEAYKDIPVVALTTENTQEAFEKGRALGFNDWIVKINAPTTLLKSINIAIDKYLPKKDIVAVEDSAAQMRRMFVAIAELNKRLLAAEENKSRFLSLIYNEFNNPLLAVTMLMKDIIEDGDKTKEEIVDSVGMIFVDILMLNSQLSNILAAAEIESATEMSNNLTNFSIQDIVDDIVGTQRFIHKDKHIKIENSINFPEMIYKDRDKFFLILRNLIENAFEFSPQEGNIILKGSVEGKNIVFYVYNTGNQIKEQSRMYDTFYHERSDFSRVHHGLGLGLAIVKHLAGFLGGLVMYAVDEGYNIFRVSVPLDPNAPSADEQNVSALVFDDTDDVGMVL